MLRLGIDVGSTTAKAIVLDDKGMLMASCYKRHLSNIYEALQSIIKEFKDVLLSDEFGVSITGSVGLGIAERHSLKFIQEVIATVEYAKSRELNISTIIDIGGEDAKIVYLRDGKVIDLRMNGNCAGGTGAFIDQMAVCLGVDVKDLDDLAKRAQNIYPIASRCGVFSKTDIQNLISRNVSKEDIAASIFRAVAVQTASALSHGIEVKPGVLMCGGPLCFITSLRKALSDYYELDFNNDVIYEDNANLIAAWGAALSSDLNTTFSYDSFIERLNSSQEKEQNLEIKNKTFMELSPVFSSEEEYTQWKSEKEKNNIPNFSIDDISEDTPLFLGIDSGSTTTKIVLIDDKGNIFFKYYAHNEGDPISAVRKGLSLLYNTAKAKQKDIVITAACCTGYGEDLIRNAFDLDYSMVETMAHFIAAQRMCKQVSFILDIGGQDMKAIYVDNGILTRMEINEACSSGCGSFLETFAQTLNMTIEEFVSLACKSKKPSDLGTRCTVFMNSKVKQVLREGATTSDIAAGLAYSVVKNCLFKVLKIRNYEELGEHIVLQGGTMRNDAVVRTFEKLTGKQVYCNNFPELMGAYGCALSALQESLNNTNNNRNLATFLSKSDAQETQMRCKGCENQCLITHYLFSSGRKYYSGNKCERVFSNSLKGSNPGKNMSLIKYQILFDRTSTQPTDYSLTIGIPRVLNMYEEYPFWHTLFAECGIRVVLSSPSTYQNYERGVHTVMSDNICFPAKLVHSHIYELDENTEVDRIFFPRVMYETAEDKTATSSLNCPIVIGYPEVVHSSIETQKPIDSPVISFIDEKLLLLQLQDYLHSLNIDKSKVRYAWKKALTAQKDYANQISRLNREVFEAAQKEKRLCIMLAGRPYHTDPLVQHKVSEMISALGVDVITEEIVRNKEIIDRESFILKQWTYVNRILNAAQWVAKENNLVHIVQTTSFGCGPDAFFVDEVRAIMSLNNKPFTLLKIDDINNVGSTKLRVRSLIDSLNVQHSDNKTEACKPFVKPARFEKNDKEERVIIAPFFTEYLSPMMSSAFEYAGYKLVQLPMGDAEENELGLRYSNNEVCYPATLIVGGYIKALQSGNYDLNKTAIGITQLGKCRATNYPALIRRAVTEAGFSQVPVIGIGGDDNADNPGFKLNYLKVAPMVLAGTFFTDWLSVFYHAIAVREKNIGDARRLRDAFLQRANPLCAKGDDKGLVELIRTAAIEFNNIPIYEDKKYPKVGITGEIFLKFNPYSHRYVPDWLMDHGIEVVPSAVHNFFLRSFVNYDFDKENNVRRFKIPTAVMRILWKWIYNMQQKCEEAASVFRFYRPDDNIYDLADYAKELLSLSAQFGEGWLLPAEIIGFLKQGCNNVISMQPFGCIANHIVARGIEKKLKTTYPQLNMLSLDFDGGVSDANIANRLLLFLQAICHNLTIYY